MSTSGYIIVGWWGVVLVLTVAFKCTHIELLRTLAVALTFTLAACLAVAGFVLVAGL